MSTSTAPISGVEEVDAIILSYLPVDTLHYLTLAQQRVHSHIHPLIADESRVWTLKLGRQLGFDIIHGRSVPYRTLFVVATARLGSVEGGPGSDSWKTLVNDISHEDWSGMMKYTITSTIAASSGGVRSLGRETLGLLVAVIDHIVLAHVGYSDVTPKALLEAIKVMCLTGCVEGWEALVARHLDIPLPVDFPMTQYGGYNSDSIHLLASASLWRLEARDVLIDLCRLMAAPTTTVQDMERLAVTYLWPITANWISQNNREWDGCYEACMEAMRRSIVEGRNPAEILTSLGPGTPIVDGMRPHIAPMIRAKIRGRLGDAASSLEMLRFFTTWLLPLTYVEDVMTITFHDDVKVIDRLLWSTTRSVDDYTTLDMMHDEHRANRSIRQQRDKDCCLFDRDHPITLHMNQMVMEHTLIRVFLARIRTVEQATRFMEHVGRNSPDGDVNTTEMSSELYRHYYRDPTRPYYPHLTMVYDAFCGRLSATMLGALIPDGTWSEAGPPPYRVDVVIAIAESIISGRSIREADEQNPIYTALLRLVRVLPTRVDDEWCHHDLPRPQDAMYGTVYGIIAASMYNEAIFAAMLETLGPAEMDDDAKVDMLVMTCAHRYAEAMRNIDQDEVTLGSIGGIGMIGSASVIGEGSATSDSTPTQSIGAQHRMEAIAHERCMSMMVEYYHSLSPNMDEWNEAWQRERRTIARVGLTLRDDNIVRHAHYPGHLLWANACLSPEPLVTSALLPMAEYRHSGSQYHQFATTETYWMGYKALKLAQPRDYEELVAISDRLSVDGIDPDAGGEPGSRGDIKIGPTRGQALTWLRGLLPLLWEADKHDALERALDRVHVND